MSETYPPTRAQESELSGWVGWVVFAGLMMIMLGFFHSIQGLVGLFDPGYYLVSADGLVVNVDYTTWGWLHLGIGLISIAAGLGLLAGNVVARVVAVVLALVSAVLNLVFIAAYPVWSSIIIAVDVIVIYAIIVHGKEVRTR